MILPKWMRRWVVPAHEARRLSQENHVLRDALREANAELFRHRQLLAGLRTGQDEVTRAFEKAISR